MPIATPEIYAQMLDRAKQQGFAYPAINVTSTQTLNAALKGFAEAESDGIIQVSTGGAEYLSGQSVKDMVIGATALAEFAHVVAKKYSGQHRAAHRPLPQGQARRLHAPAGRDLSRAGQGRPGAAVPVAHVGRLGGAAGREPRDRRGAARQVRRGQDHHGAGDRRRRRRGRRRRRRDQREALHHAGGRPRDGGGPRPRRARPLHARRDLRQRARRLQAGQRQAAPERAQGDPGRGGRQVRQGQAVRPGLPRRLRLGASPRSARRSATAW